MSILLHKTTSQSEIKLLPRSSILLNCQHAWIHCSFASELSKKVSKNISGHFQQMTRKRLHQVWLPPFQIDLQLVPQACTHTQLCYADQGVAHQLSAPHNSVEPEVSLYLILDTLVLANKEDMSYHLQGTCKVQRMLKAKHCSMNKGSLFYLFRGQGRFPTMQKYVNIAYADLSACMLLHAESTQTHAKKICSAFAVCVI